MRHKSITYSDEAEKKNERISAVITLFIGVLVLLLLYFYTFQQEEPDTPEPVTTMLINFGNSQQGSGAEEPMPSEESSMQMTEEVSPTKISEKATKELPQEKLITGTSAKRTQAVTEPKVSRPTKSAYASTQKKPSATSGAAQNAIGNLVKGKGTSGSSQGDGSGTGNQGDPLGGEGNGDSKIGTDRKLVSFIPGTMGRGGSQPSHQCTAKGKIDIKYTVDASGKVISARRSSGISDPCVINTAESWVKRYVRAEKSSGKSTGVYHIKF